MIFRRMAYAVLHSRWPTALGLALLTMILLGKTLQLGIDPSMDSLFNKSSPEYLKYKAFNETFGSDQMIALAMDNQNLFSASELSFLKELTEKIGGMPQVERVLSLAEAMDIQPRWVGVKITPVLKDVYANGLKADDIEKAKRTILSNELYLHNLVSPDGQVANVLIYLKPKNAPGTSQGSFIRELNQHLRRQTTPTRHFYIAGSPIEQYEFIRLIRRDQMIFVPTITLLLIASTWLIYRSFSCVILSMGIVFMTLIWSMGTISFAGAQLNLVTSLLAPVIMIVATSNSIHIMNLFFEIRATSEGFREAVAQTMTRLGTPSLLAHTTSAFGFFSLAASDVPAIRWFGIYAGIGTFYSYVISVLALPILLSLLPFRPKKEGIAEERMLTRIIVSFVERIQFNGKWWIIGFTFLLGFFSIFGMRRIEVNTGLVQQLRPKSQLAIATRFIDSHLTGVYSLGFVFERADGKPLVDFESLKRIDDFKTYLESQPQIVKVNGVTTVLKKINQALEGGEEGYEISSDSGRIEMFFNRMKKSKDPELWKVVSPDFKQIRLDARMRAVSTTEGTRLEERALDYLAKNMGPDLHYDLTGNVVLLGRMARGLVKSQIEGIGWAFAAVFVLVCIFFRSLRMGLLAVLPNTLPIFYVYGLMGFLQIDLSSPTAMISSIELGFVVDASIHFMYRFRREFNLRHNYLQALHHTLRRMGLSLCISSSILCIGFSASAFAGFQPTQYLGILTALTIFFSLICTLLVLPSILILLRPLGPEKTFKNSV